MKKNYIFTKKIILYFIINLFSIFTYSSLYAQTIEEPFKHGTPPEGWKNEENNRENNGLIAKEFGIEYKTEEVESNWTTLTTGPFAGTKVESKVWTTKYQGEGVVIYVRQMSSPQTAAEYKNEIEARLKEEFAENNDHKKSSFTFREERKTDFKGFAAEQFIFDTKEIFYTYTVGRLVGGAARYNTTEQHNPPLQVKGIANIVLVTISPKIQFEIFTFAASTDEPTLKQRLGQIQQFTETFEFFGGANDATTSDQTTTETGTEYVSSGDEDDNTVITVAVGAGVAAVVATIIKLLKGKAGKTNSTPTKPIKQTPPKKGDRTKDDKDKEQREKEEKEKEREREKREKEKEEKEKPKRYVLHLSQNKFHLAVGDTKPITVTIWEIDSKGTQKIASNAQIQLKSSSAALQITPTSANGQLISTLQLNQTPNQKTLTIQAIGNVNGKIIQEQIIVETEEEKSEYELRTTQLPIEKMELIPNGKDIIYFYAQLTNKNNPNDPKLAKANQNLQIKKVTTSQDWLEMSEPQLKDGWKAVGLQASDPNPNHTSSRPASVSIEVSTQIEDQFFRRIVDIPLQGEAILDVDRDKIQYPYLSVNKNAPVVIIRAAVQTNSSEKWTFTAKYSNEGETLTQIKIKPENNKEALIEFSAPTAALPPNESEIYNKLIIQAKSETQTSNERHVDVTLLQEGIQIWDGREIAADEEKASRQWKISVLVFDEKTLQLVPDEKAVRNLEFEFKNIQKEKKYENLLTVADLSFNYLDTFEQGRALYQIIAQKAVPVDDFEYPLQIKVKVHSPLAKRDFEWITEPIFVGKKLSPQDEADAEYDKIILYIKKHVPDEYIAEMLQLVKKERVHLGKEGLYKLRHDIHDRNVELILKMGQGYMQEAEWNGKVIFWLEWVEWAGDLAFNVVSATLFGPYAPAVSMSKSYSISALQWHLEGKDLDDWFSETFTLHTLFKASEGRVVDVDKIVHILKTKGGAGDKKALVIAWAAYIAYHFCYQVFWLEKSVVDALKTVAAEIKDELIVAFLVKKCRAEIEKKNLIDSNDSLNKERDIFKKNPKTGEYEISKADVLDAMSNPQKMRGLKDFDPAMRKAFNNTRDKMMNAHDAKLKEYISNQLKKDGFDIPIEDIHIHDFRSPDGTFDATSINTDRDYRVLIDVKDLSGDKVFHEYPLKKWENKSLEIFGEVSGKPTTISDADWAKQRNITPTDAKHKEACADYSDHHAVKNKNGDVLIEIKEPNINIVERGEGKLYDPKALGEMYKEKVMTNFEQTKHASHVKHSESVAQAQKGVNTLEKVRNGYDKQKIKMPEIDAKTQTGMDIVKKYPTDVQFDPQKSFEFTQEMNKAGFKGGSPQQIMDNFSDSLANEYTKLI